MDQLPPSLGGTFSPGHSPKASPRHRSPGLAGRRIVKQNSEPLIGGLGEEGGETREQQKAVNALVGVFDHKAQPQLGAGGKGGISASYSPFQAKPRPPPPAQSKSRKSPVLPSRPRAGSHGKGDALLVLKKSEFAATKAALKPSAGGGPPRGRSQEEGGRGGKEFSHVQLRSTGAKLWSQNAEEEKDSNPRVPPPRPLLRPVPTGDTQAQTSTQKSQLPGNRQPLLPPAVLKQRNAPASSTPASSHGGPSKPTQTSPVTNSTTRTSNSSIAASSKLFSPKPSGGVAARVHNFEHKPTDTTASDAKDTKPSVPPSAKDTSKFPSASGKASLEEKLSRGWSNGGNKQLHPQRNVSPSARQGGAQKTERGGGGGHMAASKTNKALVHFRLLKDRFGGGVSEDQTDGGPSPAKAAPQPEPVKVEPVASRGAEPQSKGVEPRQRPREGKWKELPKVPCEEGQLKSHGYENITVEDQQGQQTRYENVLLKSTPVPSSATGNEDDAYENVEFTSSLPTPPKSSQSNYENVDIIPSPSTSPQQGDESSDEEVCLGEVEEFAGPPEEVIYENFGPDEGNRSMTVDELEKHISTKGKQGLSAEYLKVKNEPLMGMYRACR